MAKGKRRQGRSKRPNRNKKSQSLRSTLGGNAHSRSLRLEALEDRRMMALFVVNNFGDLDGDGNPVVGSLRQAVEEANTNEGFDQIMFADFLFDDGVSHTINLDGRDNGGALVLSDIAGVEIIGPGAALEDGLTGAETPGRLTVFAGGPNRVFLVDDADEDRTSGVTISGLTLSGGSPRNDDNDGLGGAILNRENLTLSGVELRGNRASGGGGGVHNDTGFLRIENSLIRENVSGRGGGGLQNGIAEQDENIPTIILLNSTLTGNIANGGTVDGKPTGYGGGVVNLVGTVNIEQSTIYGNIASYGGGGTATQGFDPEIDAETGEPSVTSGPATTHIRSSIIAGNLVADEADDVGSIGMTEGGDDTDPVPFEPQINSLGFNLFGKLTHPDASVNESVVLPPGGSGDVTDVDPTTVFINDPNAEEPAAWLHDFGGGLPVFMPDMTKAGGLLAVDLGDPFVVGEFDQRGLHFPRAADLTGSDLAPMDIGAAEVQLGNFQVSTLVDEADGRYADVPVSEGTFPLNFLTFAPDLSLREAIAQAEKIEAIGLPGTSTIGFSELLTDPIINPDPISSTPAPTINLTLGELFVAFPLNFQGPTTFELEIDARGSDPTPLVKNGDGSRVFALSSAIEISDLILRGGDQLGKGGGILTLGDLTLKNVSLLDNFALEEGGGIYVGSGSLVVDTSSIYDNASVNSGGGIFLASGNVTINNSTLSGNVASRHGGGVANANGDLLIRYSTITLNTAASTLGSGVASFRDASATTEVRSSIISGNLINDIQHVLPGTSNIVSLGYNLVGDGNAVLTGSFAAAGDQIFADAKLAPLARLGGPTPVHRLLPGSPALDAGDVNNLGLDNVPFSDQRGSPFNRIEDGTRIDIGSYEVQDDVLLVGDVTMDPDAGYATFVAALDESNLTPTKESIVFLPTWLGEFFLEDVLITDSVDVLGLPGFGFSGANLIIDDGNAANLLDVSFDNLRFDTNTHITSQENLTLANMQFIGNQSLVNGGAIAQQNGKLTISDSTFTGNSSAGAGGAIHVVGGDLEINNSFISGSTSGLTGGSGGAIYIKDGDFTADYLYLTGNVAPGATGAGGALYANNATIHLTDATISGNSTSGSNSDGGAIAAINSNTTLINPSLSLNTTLGSQSSGGALFIDGGTLNIQKGNLSLNRTFGQDSSGGAIASLNANVTITGSSLNRNEVHGLASHGGGVYTSGGRLAISSSSVVNNAANAAGSNGGGVFSDTTLGGSQTASIINSTVSGNSAALRGGGLYNANGLLSIEYSTVTNNSVPYFGNGSGVASFANAGTTRTAVRSSIIAGNLATNDPVNPDSDVASVAGGANSFASLGYNIVGKGVAQTLNAFAKIGDQTNIVNPGLSPLSVDLASATFLHALLPTSPAINAGNPGAVAGVGNVPTNDQRGMGFTRVGIGRIDVGSYESDLSPILFNTSADFDNDGDIDGADFLSWQRGFGITSGASPSDGDANEDGAVNGADLVIWEMDFGTVSSSGALALVSSGGGEESPLAAVVTTSEPLVVAAVLSPSSPLTGLTLNSIVVSSIVGEVGKNVENETANPAAIDQSFADFSQLPTSLSYDGLDADYQAAGEASDEELEFSLEDHIFELLGTDA